MKTPIIICKNIKGGSGNTLFAINLCNECGTQKIFTRPLLVQLSLYPDLQSYMELGKKTDILTLHDFISNEGDKREAIKCVHQKNSMFILPSSEKNMRSFLENTSKVKQIIDWLCGNFEIIFIDMDHSVPEMTKTFLAQNCSLQLVTENYDQISMDKTESYLKQIDKEESQKTYRVINQYPKKIKTKSVFIPENEKIFGILPFSAREIMQCVLYKSPLKLKRGSLKKEVIELAKKIPSALLKKDS